MTSPDQIGDDLQNEIIIEEWDESMIVQRALEYPVKQTKELYYPAKSYAIGLIYSLLLVKHFGGELLTYLDDPLLLFGNDPYFKPYRQNKSVYDELIEKFPPEAIHRPRQFAENFQKTVDYFYKEFLLEQGDEIHALDQ
jgi:hypothetical protein